MIFIGKAKNLKRIFRFWTEKRIVLTNTEGEIYIVNLENIEYVSTPCNDGDMFFLTIRLHNRAHDVYIYYDSAADARNTLDFVAEKIINFYN